MSTSRDNLPAVEEPKTSVSNGRLAAVEVKVAETEEKMKSIPESLLGIGRKMLGASGLNAVVAIGFVVWATLYAKDTQAQQVRQQVTEQTKVLADEIAAVKVIVATRDASTQYEIQRVRSDVADLSADVSSVKADVRGSREDFRTFAAGRPLPALPKDGGN